MLPWLEFFLSLSFFIFVPQWVLLRASSWPCHHSSPNFFLFNKIFIEPLLDTQFQICPWLSFSHTMSYATRYLCQCTFPTNNVPMLNFSIHINLLVYIIRLDIIILYIDLYIHIVDALPLKVCWVDTSTIVFGYVHHKNEMGQIIRAGKAGKWSWKWCHWQQCPLPQHRAAPHFIFLPAYFMALWHQSPLLLS